MPADPTTVFQLASAATAMARTAERFVDTFSAAGMNADFVDQFHAAFECSQTRVGLPPIRVRGSTAQRAVWK